MLSYLMEYSHVQFPFSISDFDENLVKYVRKKYEDFKNKKIRIGKIKTGHHRPKYDISDFNDFILMKSVNDKMYRCLGENDLEMEWIPELYTKSGFKECPFCFKRVNISLFEKHIKDEVNPDEEKNDASSVKVLIDFDCDKKSILIVNKNVKDAKKEISDILKISVSKLHLFDGKRALKSSDVILNNEVTLKLKR